MTIHPESLDDISAIERMNTEGGNAIMGMNLSVYVGPYFIIAKESCFRWMDWENVLCDGRGEAGVDESDLILIPNRKLDGVERPMHIDGEQGTIQINPAMIVKETAAFVRLADEVIRHCDDRLIEIREAWGVVPCWS